MAKKKKANMYSKSDDFVEFFFRVPRHHIPLIVAFILGVMYGKGNNSQLIKEFFDWLKLLF